MRQYAIQSRARVYVHAFGSHRCHFAGVEAHLPSEQLGAGRQESGDKNQSRELTPEPGAGSRELGAVSRESGAGSREVGAGARSRRRETGIGAVSRELELGAGAGTGELGAGSREPELGAGSWEPGVGNLEPGARTGSQSWE